ncbi:MAG: site-specific DNA-methyltransferase [Planctomycetes bacterium]|nr:site-specific DNA-methyltransferase [Planctomycetota bacterium]
MPHADFALFSPPATQLDGLLPDWARDLVDLQTAIPELARDARRLAELDCVIGEIPTLHRSVHGDARELVGIDENSVHLVLTSPPCWTLKEYRDSEGQLGHLHDYHCFLAELDRVGRRCFDALVPGGRLICVVGGVCLSRRKNNGRNTVVPLHASIQEHCREIGFDNLAPIIWNKIANVVHEVDNGGGGFLGKPYHPAPFPITLADRLICMFSFVGDTVLDPFSGTGSTAIAAIGSGRHSIGYEIDGHYVALARRRILEKTGRLLCRARFEAHDLC